MYPSRLHRTYRESSPVDEGSTPKKVKFANVQSSLTAETGMAAADCNLSKAVAQAFPRANTKRKGKKLMTFIQGIQAIAPTTPMLPDITEPEEEEEVAERQNDVQRLQDQNKELQERIQGLECRLKALEQQKTYTYSELDRQMYTVMQRGVCTASGPDTQEHFERFSFDAITTELMTHAPDLYRLFLDLGDVRRRADDDDDAVTIPTMKATTSLCTLLNARSARVKGFQLMMGLMLIARATSKQVCVQ